MLFFGVFTCKIEGYESIVVGWVRTEKRDWLGV